MTAPSTYELHYRTAVTQPAKGRRYVASITDTLSRDGIGPIEQARLREALRGLADGLDSLGITVCEDCGRELHREESIVRGRGAICAHKSRRRQAVAS